MLLFFWDAGYETEVTDTLATLTEYRRQMLQSSPSYGGSGLGRIVPITSLGATTAVSNALKVGTLSAQTYTGQWMVRATASDSADRERLISAYTSSSGTLTHAGTNYADTTATSEYLEVLEYPVYLFDSAIAETIRRLRRRDRSIAPTLHAGRRYWLNKMTWITAPGDIEKVCFTANPVMSNNRYFEKWNTLETDSTSSQYGALFPDDWIFSAGTAPTVARETTTIHRGAFSCKVTRASADVTMYQDVGLLENGITGDSLRGKSVVAAAQVNSSVASQVRLQVNDGVDTTSSSYHTGGGTFEELTVTHTVNSAATRLRVQITIADDNTAAYVDECYIASEQSSISDDLRRDAYPEHELVHGPDYEFAQGAGTLAIIMKREPGAPGQLAVYSQRPHPGFITTRLSDGTADSDSSDAPLIPVAAGAIARLYEGLAQTESPDRPRFLALSDQWEARFQTMAGRHLYTHSGTQRDFGLPVPPAATLAPAARRRR